MPPKNKKPIISFSKITKVYLGDFVALKDIDLKIMEGEFISIVGHSGAGKTTLLKMLLAEEAPTSGNVFYG